MEILFNALYKIDITADEPEKLPNTQNQSELKNYLIDLLDIIVKDQNNKGFEFQSEYTEIRSLISDISRIAEGDSVSFDNYSKIIAQRLLSKEIASDAKNNLKVELVKGIAVICLVKLSNNIIKVVISKADYNEFLDAESYEKRNGFPLKKKIYKAFTATIESETNITDIHVYDTYSIFTVYWWRDFLELSEIYTDDYNTKHVFAAIEKEILNPIKRKHKADHVSLWNATVHYFRVRSEFTLENFLDDIISTYTPFDPDLDLKQLAAKTTKLFEKGKFDKRFAIKADKITKEFKKSIELTPQIELKLKSDIENIDHTIMRYQQPNGTKWVMVKSDTGFEFFKDRTDIMPS